MERGKEGKAGKTPENEDETRFLLATLPNHLGDARGEAAIWEKGNRNPVSQLAGRHFGSFFLTNTLLIPGSTGQLVVRRHGTWNNQREALNLWIGNMTPMIRDRLILAAALSSCGGFWQSAHPSRQ